MNRIFKSFLLGWIILSVAFWIYYSIYIEFVVQIMYYFIWLGIIGSLVFIFRDKLRDFVQRKKGGFFLFLGIGYFMVLLEELFAAFLNHLTEGFSFPLFFERVGQFWVFNVFAFTGLFVGLYLLTRKIEYSFLELFFLSGAIGIFSEGIYLIVFSNPLEFFFSAPLIVLTYGLIVTPALWSLSPIYQKRFSSLTRYILGIVVLFVGVVVSGIVVDALRRAWPWIFPPEKFIPL